MTKEALNLALEALETLMIERGSIYDQAITAIKEALAQPAQEPVAFASHGVINWIADKQFQHEADLYVTPPQRTWVCLTDDEVYRIAFELEGEQVYRIAFEFEGGHWRKIVDAIEAKIKEKNNTTLAEQTGEESSILFSLNDGKEVMRIDKNGVTANPEIRVDEAGAHVISALDVHIKNLIKAERNACAKIAETPVFGEQDDITMEAKDRIANDIRAR